MSRLIDADALKADYGMKDDCKDCEKDTPGYVRNCQYNTVYSKMDFCGWIDSAPTIEPERTGKWIEYDNSHCECPFCHEEWSYFDNEVERFNCCPNCGERMES